MSTFSRRQFIGKTALATAPIIFIPGISNAWRNFQPEYKIIDTPYGKLRGYRENDVNIFKGVPYAGDISGEKGFRKPALLNHGQVFGMHCNWDILPFSLPIKPTG